MASSKAATSSRGATARRRGVLDVNSKISSPPSCAQQCPCLRCIRSGGRYLDQELVALGMAQRIVDQLEVVEIQQYHAHTSVPAGR